MRTTAGEADWEVLEGDEEEIALPFELGSPREQAASTVMIDKQLCGCGVYFLEKVRLWSSEQAC